MRPPIDGAAIVITGASSGIGRAMVEALAPRARTLVVVARSGDLLHALREEILADLPHADIRVMPYDLADMAQREELLARLEAEVDPIDCLINCAGFGRQSALTDTDPETIHAMIAVNCEALTHLCQALVPGMVARGRGGVLNVGSQLGLIVQPAMAVYSATKHYVDAISEALRANVRGTGVVITQLCPGPVRSGFADVAGYDYTPGSARDRLAISSAECARQGIEGFEAGKALVMTSASMRVFLAIATRLPRWAQRLISRRMARATDGDRMSHRGVL